MARERLLVALSGGVDSSVAALLLKQQGHDVVCAYMKNWINEDNVIGNCPWLQDIADARAVCEKLGVEFRVVNLMHDYRRLVVDYLLDGYQRGLTPNPDVMCNSRVKFGVFAAYARGEGFTGLATGHYARRVDGGRGFAPRPSGNDVVTSGHNAAPTAAPNALGTNPQRYALIEGADKNKDQSYFLALLNQEQLAFARFPIGHLAKPKLRTLATDAGLPTAEKKDSQGICFIGEVKMADFLRAYVPEQPGPIVRAADGRTLGEHRGLHYYTIGQRKGIGIPSNTDHQAYVVVGKRAADNTLLVAFDGPTAPGLWTTECRVHSLSFIGEPLTAPTRLECRVRYRDPRVPVEFTPETDSERWSSLSPATTERSGVAQATSPAATSAPTAATLRFATPQRALASGQILALYRGEELLGGGVFA
ncbi:MAG: tRNA 2-thiouridine(34) synthase MnmA [Opitutus sp.]|nr:tRNA 2-thiouridine(34) synthase MnmA [Opitutus sp.]